MCPGSAGIRPHPQASRPSGGKDTCEAEGNFLGREILEKIFTKKGWKIFRESKFFGEKL